MNWFFRALGRYGEFRGRSRRKEYWWFVVISWLLDALLLAGFMATSGDAVKSVDGEIVLTSSLVTNTGWALLIAAIAVSVILIIPYWSVTVRRMHDSGKSGFWALFLLFLPIVVLILALLRGDATANKHGLNPVSAGV